MAMRMSFFFLFPFFPEIPWVITLSWQTKKKKEKKDMPTEPAATSCSLAAGLNSPVFLCLNHCAAARCAVHFLPAACMEGTCRPSSLRGAKQKSRRRAAICAPCFISSRVRLPRCVVLQRPASQEGDLRAVVLAFCSFG